jgi:SAM-dependent methyltransferase
VDDDDPLFYETDRFVQHLDAKALETVEWLLGELIIEEHPVILDLMGSWDSHLPKTLEPSRVVGLGLNERELRRNTALDEFVLHDLNEDPHLPFPDKEFDIVLNTVSVDYMTQPVKVFRDVGRILKPGGLFLVIFSNRMFREKAVKIWRESSEAGRVDLVKSYFGEASMFDPPQEFASLGQPRPENDKYAHLGIPSDPVWAIYSDKEGGARTRPERPTPLLESAQMPSKDEIKKRKQKAHDTLRCPYCNVRMKKWAVPQTPFTQWDSEFMYVCFNDSCPYLVGGWETMTRQGNPGFSYRIMYEPRRDTFIPVSVPNLQIMKDGIVDEK